MFVDKARVKLIAGNGGNGAVSFRHEKFVDKGGPDGGDGGHGGDIILKASRNQNTLATFRYQKLLKAEDGAPGFKRRKHGKSGKNLEVAVPVGTVVNSEDGQLLADLVEDGQTAVIAHGGKGGFGNAHFVSSVRQAPRVAEKGEQGEELDAQLELKMIADVGIVGLPNAGKSTFLSVVSNAHPEIADYPFTTIRPNLGVADVDGSNSLLLADIPGLIEGASQGKGLGDEFLRHVERTAIVVHLIDIYNDDVVDAYKTIIEELAAYKTDLAKKPQLVALSKVEGYDPKKLAAKVKLLSKTVPKNTPVISLSSISGEGVKELLRELQRRVDKNRAKTQRKLSLPKIPVIGLRVDEDVWKVAKDGKKFVVSGNKIERFARRTKFDEYHSQQRLRDIMRKMGIMHELASKGAEPGQDIVIGSPEIGRIDY